MRERSKRTVRRENKRLAHKQERAIEKQAMEHPEHLRSGYAGEKRIESPIIDDEALPPPKTRRKKQKDHSCPARPGKRHECLEDTREVPVYKYKWIEVPERRYGDIVQPAYRTVKMVQDGTKTERYKICVHCGAEWVRMKRFKRWGGGSRWSRRSSPRPMV